MLCDDKFSEAAGASDTDSETEQALLMEIEDITGRYDLLRVDEAIAVLQDGRAELHQDVEKHTRHQADSILLSHEAGFGVVDTGCARGVVGADTLKEFEEAANIRKLSLQWLKE